MGTALGDGVVALAGVVGTVCGHAGNVLVRLDLVQYFRQNWCVANVVTGEFDGPDFRCFLIDPKVDLAPDAALRAAVLARVPLAFVRPRP
jgi:hypothetical protein